MVNQRDTADVSYAQVEARVDREGAPAQESSAVPSSETSLSGLASSGTSGILPKKPPRQKQMIREYEDERKEQECEEKGNRWSKGGRK